MYETPKMSKSTRVLGDVASAMSEGHNRIMTYNELANCINIFYVNKPARQSDRLSLSGFSGLKNGTFNKGGTSFEDFLRYTSQSKTSYSTVIGSWRA